MPLTRRELLARGLTAAVAGGALLQSSRPAYAADKTRAPWAIPPQEPAEPGRDFKPVITPNGVALTPKIVGGIKIFHLIAEEVEHEFAPGLKVKCWGFNGRVHGPTIEGVVGDHCRIYVTNKLPVSTSIHWHAILVPNGMDGVGGLTQKPIEPGETFKYEFILPNHGTFMYHSHHNEMTQIALGLMGLFIIHPRNPKKPPPDRDYAILLNEWKIPVGAARPNPLEMTDFNIFTFNAKAFPATEPLIAKLGEVVRIRIANLSPTDHHPIHIHGHSFRVVATDGGDIPESAQWPETMAFVPVGSSRTIEFVADNPGDWLFHCHMTHHMMNQMGHNLPNLVGIDTNEIDRAINPVIPNFMTMTEANMSQMEMPTPPNSIPMLSGKGPFGEITSGGMVTIIKVRENLEDAKVKGYDHPENTVSRLASPDEIKRDGIVVNISHAAGAIEHQH